MLLLGTLFVTACFTQPSRAMAQDAEKPKAENKPAGEIFFASDRSGSWRVWSIHPDGSDPRQVIEGAKDDEMDVDPNFSSNGKKIVFTSTRGGTTGIWMANSDGSGVTRICEGRQAEWSPDDKKIAFAKNDKIFVRELESGKEKQIVPDSYKICSVPAWSPEGKKIAFACRWEAGNGLFIVSAEGGEEPIKIFDKKGACEPHWSPDGSLLAYETETHICTIQPDGQKPRQITSWGGVQRYAQWSPDGKRFVFCHGNSEKGPWLLYSMPSTGGPPSAATPLTEEGSNMNPDWR